ncbi:Heterokaryon incompatibility protein 6 [Emericellopsis cladophorae]|uniref:Heterokaryon incompatibility protein 6 n=1 Tax=Emericellopsis cladophorae TaxID=2686198 RepID=A0A9P9Y028_9HYPO|nr:Heterokaryon incompatibility protein 6 [Emericellopsis cladophorae]KAI6780865.1 Heterokaryon incompatibility protein 6 [Emericellopsis cladophorae]
MVLVKAIIATAALSTLGAAQANDEGITVYAAAAYVVHGDKTPSLGSLHETLTPVGAQQLYRQGSAFRNRYTNGSSAIDGLEESYIDNRQVDALVADDEWVAAGALAFFQGLYPPNKEGFIGGRDLGNDLASSGSDSVGWPLDGYQYPLLQTLSWNDSASPAVRGSSDCYTWQEKTDKLNASSNIKQLTTKSASFYKDLFSSGPLKGTIKDGYATLWNAVELYELVSYMYAHNQTVHDKLDNANETISQLEDYAFSLAQAKNQDPDDEDDEAKALINIAGRTLATKVASQLQRNLGSQGDLAKLSVLFGSYEPLMAFLSVANVLTRENTLSGPFTTLPKPGAAMIFELIGDTPDDTSKTPDATDLRIRFLYRATADEDEEVQGFSLFGSGYGGKSIPYTAFQREMNDKGATTEEWCNICNSSTPFCPSKSSDGDAGEHDEAASDLLGSNSRIHPALAGLIGAVVMGATLGIAGFLLIAIGGFRVRRVSENERSSSGFRGEPDKDVAVGARGVSQERIGSWEMRGGRKEGGAESVRDVDDGSSVFGATVTRPKDVV